MKIENMQHKDIRIVALLHTKNLKSPGSKIGYKYITKLYDLLLSKQDSHICLVAHEQNKIAGSITATTDLSQTNGLFKKLLTPTTIFLILQAVIFKRVSFVELLKRFKFERELTKKASLPYATILTLFVSNEFQRRGFGKKLVQEIERKFKENGIKKIYVDTLSTNTNALIFYQKLGFKKKIKIIDSIILEKQLSIT